MPRLWTRSTLTSSKPQSKRQHSTASWPAFCLIDTFPRSCDVLLSAFGRATFCQSCVVIKKLARPDHYKYFEHDKSTYQRLEAVQGKLLLVYYGEGTCEHCFTERITLALDEMIACAGVVQEDTKLNNIMLADNGRIVFLDMEYVCDPVAGPKLSAARKWAI